MIEDVDHWGKGAPRLKHVGAVKSALAMNRKPWICEKCQIAYPLSLVSCPECGEVLRHRRRIFVNSLSDWLDDEVPVKWLAELLDTIRKCPYLIWILCSKRPENFMSRMTAFRDSLKLETEPSLYNDTLRGWITRWIQNVFPPKNIIILASVENQAMADKRIPELLKIPAACRGLSCEPILEPIRFPHVVNMDVGGRWIGNQTAEISWIIAGVESGPKRRDCDGEWIRDIVTQGKSAGVAVFVKQILVNGKVSTKPAEWPDWAKVQEWPKL